MEQRSPRAERADGEAAAQAAKYPYRIEDTGEGAWTVYSNEPIRTAAGALSDRGRVVEVFLGKTAEEVAETTCRILNEEALRNVPRMKDPEDVTTSRSVKARDLKSGYSVKAPGAPAWSPIRSIGGKHVPGGVVTANLDWGSIVYRPDEDVEIEAVSLKKFGTPGSVPGPASNIGSAAS